MFKPDACIGEVCRLCKLEAYHKVEEIIFDDDPCTMRHAYTAYVCTPCFRLIMGEWAHADR